MKKVFFALAALFFASLTQAETLGAVSTGFKLLGPNNQIAVEVFDDPRVQGVSCYLSRAKKGGITGALGIAEDKSDSSVACRQVGNISFVGPLPQQEEVFTEKASLLFKHVRVVRLADKRRNALVYLVYSDRLLEGSPMNSVTAVPVPASQPIPVR